jgi:anion-transporting  ArsA/GET3 family ATPase
VVGPGGVGKTTMAAALATAAAASGRRTVVVTIDPARRLAQSLGLEGTAGNEIVEAGEGLWATMLDAEAGWDELVRRHSRDAATAERIISNALYRNVTGRFVHSLNYLAMERLGQLVDDPRFDLVVVDTPPSHNALDFLDSPERMEEFFSGRLLRWITAPARNKVVSLTSRPFLAVADRVLGARFVSDIVEFFTLLAGVEPGLRRRAAGIADLLRSPETRFALVTTPEPGPAAETRSLTEALAGRGMAPWMCFVNRCATAPTCRDPDPTEALAGLLGAAGERDPARVAAPLVRVVEADRTAAVRHGAAVGSLGEVMPVMTLGELGNADPVGVVNGLAVELAGVMSADAPSGGGVLRDRT